MNVRTVLFLSFAALFPSALAWSSDDCADLSGTYFLRSTPENCWGHASPIPLEGDPFVFVSRDSYHFISTSSEFKVTQKGCGEIAIEYLDHFPSSGGPMRTTLFRAQGDGKDQVSWMGKGFTYQYEGPKGNCSSQCWMITKMVTVHFEISEKGKLLWDWERKEKYFWNIGYPGKNTLKLECLFERSR